MEVIKINNYSFKKPLVSVNSGFSKWGIGTRGGRSYFVKEFLSPVYPAADAVFTEKKKQERIQLCKSFVEEKKELYQALREVSDGRLVTVEQFFRVGAKFYMSTKAITDPVVSIEDISRCSFADQLRLCCSIAHSMAGVHEKRIIHADIKPDNILVVRKKTLEANIIDFDCGFFEKDRPKLGEELNGDLVYLSPEGFLHIAGIESNLSCKMDVFALGLLFCQYFTGKLPEYDTEEYQYAYETVLDNKSLGLQNVTNGECRELLERMLKKNPNDRPDMNTVFVTLRGILLRHLNRREPGKVGGDGVRSAFFLAPAGDL